MPSKKDNFDDDFFDDKLDSGPNNDFYSSNELTKKGIYYIYGEIETCSLLSIHQDILLKHMDPKWNDDVQIIVNSFGGCAAEGFSLIDLLNWVRMDVRTVAIGFCGSMGACVACCGTPGKRFVTKNASIMIHGASWGADGNVHQIATVTKEMQREHERHVDFWLRHSKYSKREDIEKYFLHGRNDEYMSAEEAIRHGIFDGICGESKTPTLKKKLSK